MKLPITLKKVFLFKIIFFGFQNLWVEFTDIVFDKIPTESLSLIQVINEQSKRDQFLMKLCSDFESVRSNLMNRDPSPSLDVWFMELLVKSDVLSNKMLSRRKMTSLLHLLLKVKERAGI